MSDTMTLPPDDTALACDEAEALLPLVADGTLDADGDPALFAHLARCSDCQESLARHDQVSMALEHGVLEHPVQDRALRYRLPRAWAALIAATLVMVVGAAWMSASRGHTEHALAAKLAAMPPHDVLAEGADTEVIRVSGQDPSHPYYVILRDGRAVLVDPKQDQQGRRSRPPLAHPVGLNRY